MTLRCYCLCVLWMIGWSACVSSAEPVVLIDGRAPQDLNCSAHAGADASFEVIAVEDQPFTQAMRVTVNQPFEPVWGVQVLSQPSTQAVRKGDVLVGQFYIRAEPIGGSRPDVWGFLQRSVGEFEQLAWLGQNPPNTWKKVQFKAVAEHEYPAGSVTVSFHLGKTAQKVELADLVVSIEQPTGTPPEPSSVTPMDNPLDPQLEQQLGSQARLIIAGNRPHAFKGPGPALSATRQLVDVPGDPRLVQAARVQIEQATDPVWDAQLTSPATTDAIRQGDVLFGVLDIRATSAKESGGGQFVGWLQSDEGGWTGLLKIDGAPGDAWTRRYFMTRAERDFQAGSVNLVLHLGLIPQQVEVANMLLYNLGPAVDLESLPRTQLTYVGQASDAPWRSRAWEKIEQHRKADVRITVLDSSGQPVRDADVAVKPDKLAFEIGTFLDNDSPVLWANADGDRFRQTIDAYFDRVTCPSYGAQTWGWPDPSTRERYLQTLAWAADNSHVVKAHPVIWSRFDWSPQAWSDARGNPSELMAEVEAYLVETCRTLASAGVQEVDLVNEPVGFHELEDIIADPGMRARWYRLAHEAAPRMRLLINEHSILSAGGINTAKHDAYAGIIRDLIERGAPLHGIGFQGHMGEDFTPPEQLWRVLDRFAEFGLPLHITEFDVNSADPQTRADYTRDFLIAMLAHPSVQSVTFWGFWGGKMWIPHAELWRKDWSPTPTAEAFTLLMDQLHQEMHGRSDALGQLALRPFKGTHLITVTHGGQTLTVSQTLDADAAEWVVRLKE